MPRSERPRSMTFTLSEEQYRKLVTLAEESGRSADDFLRHEIDKRHEKLSHQPLMTECDECAGSGEVQAECCNCGLALFLDNSTEDGDLCSTCAKKG